MEHGQTYAITWLEMQRANVEAAIRLNHRLKIERFHLSVIVDALGGST